MNILVATVSISMALSGLVTPVTTTHADDLAPPIESNSAIAEIIENPAVDLIDEAMVVEELENSGFDEAVVEESSDGLVSVEAQSKLGDGAEITSYFGLDYASLEGELEVVGDEIYEVVGAYSVEILELNEDEIAFTITDVATGESQIYSDQVGDGSALALIPGIPLVISVLQSLLRAGLVYVVKQVTYIALGEAIKALSQGNSDYQHFVAVRVQSGPLRIGRGLTYREATSRITGGADTWSRSSAGAQSVCRNASGGRRPNGPEIDRDGAHKVHHYHQDPRGSSHCFYGSPRP